MTEVIEVREVVEGIVTPKSKTRKAIKLIVVALVSAAALAVVATKKTADS